MSVSNRYRVACIGAGRMASWFDDIQRERAQHDGGRSLEWVPGAIASVCEAIDRLELVAVCDLQPERVEQMQARWNVPAGYTDYREMVERERPDIVAIVTAKGSVHASLAAGVAEMGVVKAIYCEKPVAASMAEADRVVEACREHSVVYTCAHVFRWNARYLHILHWIRDGAIGELRAITCSAMGTLAHSGTHQTDVMAGWAGDIDPEWAMGTVDPPAGASPAQTVDPPGGGYIRLRNGVDLLMEARSPWPRTFHISGTEGKIMGWNDLRQVQLWRKPHGGKNVELVPGEIFSPPQLKSYTVTQMEELIHVLDHGGTTSCDAVKAARALEMVLGIHLSDRQEGARVSFPLTDRTFGIDAT